MTAKSESSSETSAMSTKTKRKGRFRSSRPVIDAMMDVIRALPPQVRISGVQEKIDAAEQAYRAWVEG